MPDQILVKSFETKCRAILRGLDERGRRRWAADEAMSIGRGEIAAVSQTTGIFDQTIRTGISELKFPEECPPIASIAQAKEVNLVKSNNPNFKVH